VVYPPVTLELRAVTHLKNLFTPRSHWSCARSHISRTCLPPGHTGVARGHTLRSRLVQCTPFGHCTHAPLHLVLKLLANSFRLPRLACGGDGAELRLQGSQPSLPPVMVLHVQPLTSCNEWGRPPRTHPALCPPFCASLRVLQCSLSVLWPPPASMRSGRWATQASYSSCMSSGVFDLRREEGGTTWPVTGC